MISSSDLRSIDLFAGMPPEQIHHFTRNAADVRLDTGEILLHEGERSAFYVLLEGQFQGTKIVHGVQHDLVRFDAGEFFGELANLLGVASGITIVAEAPCRLARFELQQLQELLQTSSPSSEKILRKMSQRVLDAQQFVLTVPIDRVVISATDDSRSCHKI